MKTRVGFDDRGQFLKKLFTKLHTNFFGDLGKDIVIRNESLRRERRDHVQQGEGEWK